MATTAIKALKIFLTVNSAFLLIQAKECPSQDMSTPCTCMPRTYLGTMVTCTGINDVNILYKEVQKFRSYHIDFMQFIELNLPYFPAGLFEGLSVTRFHIQSSHLNNLYSTKNSKATAFEGLEDSLSEIEVTNTTNPSNWYWPDMKQFKKLQVFSFYNSPLNFVGHHFAEIGGGSLRQLTVKNGKVDRIHPQAFQEMTNVNWADFEGNRLVYLVRTMFPNPALNLEILSFRNNRLSSVDENMFENMPKLNFIDLARNAFKHFNDKASLPVLGQLRTLFVADNPYECECNLKPLRQLMDSQTLTFNDLDKVTCINEGQYKKTKLKDIDFDAICKK